MKILSMVLFLRDNVRAMFAILMLAAFSYTRGASPFGWGLLGFAGFVCLQLVLQPYRDAAASPRAKDILGSIPVFWLLLVALWVRLHYRKPTGESRS
jgi:hypothetical protein